MKVRRISGPLAFVAASLLVALPVTGADRPRNGSGSSAARGIAGRPVPPPAFGTVDYSVSSQWAGGMNVAYEPATIFSADNGSGYYHMTAAGDDLVGSFQVPSGVVIDHIGFENCDTVGGRWTMFLYDDGGPLIDAFSSSAKAGCGWDLTPNGPFGYQYPNNEFHSLTIYVLQDDSAPTDDSDGIRGLNVYWRRQVSPAPAVATFNDVPTNHIFFQFVEALVASGITAGCGGGDYCPDNPVTRGQMAAFLSIALGLHFPN